MGEIPNPKGPLLVAPLGLRPALINMIDEQIQLGLSGKEAAIIIKCNGITDKGILDKLIEASCSGVKIKLFVRGICCIRAGVKGHTENIVVKSIVGRYLEHSRIFVFGVGAEQKIFISSADLMTRNTQRRIEVATPILDKRIRDTLIKMLDVMDRDNVKSRVMNSDASYSRVEKKPDEDALDSQMYFFEMFANEEIIDNKSIKTKKPSENKGGFIGFVSRWFKNLFK